MELAFAGLHQLCALLLDRLESAGQGGALLPIASLRMARLLSALEHAYRVLGAGGISSGPAACHCQQGWPG